MCRRPRVLLLRQILRVSIVSIDWQPLFIRSSMLILQFFVCGLPSHHPLHVHLSRTRTLGLMLLHWGKHHVSAGSKASWIHNALCVHNERLVEPRKFVQTTLTSICVSQDSAMTRWLTVCVPFVDWCSQFTDCHVLCTVSCSKCHQPVFSFAEAHTESIFFFCVFFNAERVLSQRNFPNSFDCSLDGHIGERSEIKKFGVDSFSTSRFYVVCWFCECRFQTFHKLLCSSPHSWIQKQGSIWQCVLDKNIVVVVFMHSFMHSCGIFKQSVPTQILFFCLCPASIGNIVFCYALDQSKCLQVQFLTASTLSITQMHFTKLAASLQIAHQITSWLDHHVCLLPCLVVQEFFSCCVSTWHNCVSPWT